MSDRVLVMVPSRERPEALLTCLQSMLDTSEQADAVCYVDRDQIDRYAQVLDSLNPAIENFHNGQVQRQPRESRIRILHGKQVGPVAASNLIAHHYRDPYTIYGMVPDDSVFLRGGWDRYLIDVFDSLRSRIGVVAAAHNGGEYVNFPWVSREWIETVGWYYYPDNFHHCCDTLIEVLAECANVMTYADHDRFEMRHDLIHTFNREKFDGDALNFLTWCVGERRAVVKRLRAAVSA